MDNREALAAARGAHGASGAQFKIQNSKFKSKDSGFRNHESGLTVQVQGYRERFAFEGVDHFIMFATGK